MRQPKAPEDWTHSKNWRSSHNPNREKFTVDLEKDALPQVPHFPPAERDHTTTLTINGFGVDIETNVFNHSGGVRTRTIHDIENLMKNSIIQPYLFFGGRCHEALDFYRSALGAEVDMIMLYKDSPEAMPPGMLAPGFENKVMHATFHIGGNTLMGSDGCGEAPNFAGFSLSLALPTEAEVDRAFSALAKGGQVKMPLVKTFWSQRFGMLTDKFGIGWMVTVTP